MNEIKIFENEDFGQIRVVEKEGDPWFVASDVCKALDIHNTKDAVGRLDDDERGVASIDTLGGPQSMITVNEPGLYSLVLGSRKPEAKAFKRWITHEVIPSIRKTGGYIQGQEQMSDEEIIANAMKVANRILEEREKRIAALEQEKALMQPKADYFDALVDANLLTNFRDAAKELGVGQKELIDFCLESGFVYRTATGRIRPRKEYTGAANMFVLKDFHDGDRAGVQTLITPRGKESLRMYLYSRIGRMSI